MGPELEVASHRAAETVIEIYIAHNDAEFSKSRARGEEEEEGEEEEKMRCSL
jgi:hypothetical protein